MIKINHEYIESVSKEVKTIYVETLEGLVPLDVVSLKHANDEFFKLKFKGIDNESALMPYLQKPIYLLKDSIPPSKGKNFYSHEIFDFEVYDIEKKYIGNVIHVNLQTPQKILEIAFDDRIIMIPIHDTIIQSIDRQRKRIDIHAPEGLIDLYLKE